MKHRASPRFWQCYHRLEPKVRETADHCYGLLRQNPRHPSLQLKKVGRHWSARVGLHHRALAVEAGDDLLWYWIGSHAEYDKLIVQH